MKRKIGTLNNFKIEQMVKEGIIEEPYELDDIGNYIASLVINNSFTQKEKKYFLESFVRMRKKYSYAYYINKPLHIFKCIQRNPSLYEFFIEPNFYKRIAFTNYELNDFERIELQPSWYEPSILNLCVEAMKDKGLSLPLYAFIKNNIHQYSSIANTTALPQRVKTQLEQRYIFLFNQYQLEFFNPYSYEVFTKVLPDFYNLFLEGFAEEFYYHPEKYEYLFDGPVVFLSNEERYLIFDKVMNHFDIDLNFFEDKTRVPKPEDGLFRNELNYLKKYLALAYIYDKEIFPKYIDQKQYQDDIEYKIFLKDYIVKNEEVYTNLEELYYLLLIPQKVYEPISVHSKEYKRIFHSFRKRFSLWQTQRIMKRYMSIVKQMEQPIPDVILDLVDVFLDTYLASDSNTFCSDSFDEYRERVLKDI